jgi:16S rRNA (guanine527-N7)-methyltransferase
MPGNGVTRSVHRELDLPENEGQVLRSAGEMPAIKSKVARHAAAGDYESLWPDQLESGLAAMGLNASRTQQHKLLAYLGLLLKWNHAYNLTAIREPLEMVSRQLLDSLSILPLTRGPRVLDVGTGAGLPGVPLAILLPEIEFTLLDTNSKKTRFVNQVKLELGLDNLIIVQQRVERFQPENRYDTITSRAFASLIDMLQGSRHLLAEDGQWLAMKGLIPEQEIADLDPVYDVSWEVLSVPGECGMRHAIIIQ